MPTAINRMWRRIATVCALVLFAISITAAILWGGAKSGPVIVVDGQIWNTTERVKIGGQIGYTVAFEIRDSCPAEIVSVYRSLNPLEDPSVVYRVVEARRPGVYVAPGTYGSFEERKGVPVTMPLPTNVSPGRWNISITRTANCPTRRQTDPIGSWNFDVVP